MNGEFHHAGIRCSEVLQLLPSILDGDAAATDSERVGEHLRHCENCAAFASEYSSLLTLLQRTQKEPSTGESEAPSPGAEAWMERVSKAIRDS